MHGHAPAAHASAAHEERAEEGEHGEVAAATVDAEAEVDTEPVTAQPAEAAAVGAAPELARRLEKAVALLEEDLVRVERGQWSRWSQ